MTIDWPKVVGRMRADLDRAALNERPRMVLAVLIKVTVLKRRTVVVLPDRDVLCGLLGIAKQHMGGVWREIESARIATFRKVEFGWEVVLQPDASQWACDWVCTREQLNQWVQQIEQMPGQAQGSLLPFDPNLRKAMAENGAEQVSNQNGYSKPQAVTKMVTASGEQHRSSVLSTDNSSTVSTALYKADKTVEQIKQGERATEAALFDNLKRILESSPFESDRQDLAAWGGHWRVKHIRPDPDKFAAALRIVRSEIAGGMEAKKSRAAWIKDLLRR